MNHEYLVSHGNAAEFGRFRAVEALECRRGDRVVIRTQRGLEIGVVLRRASSQAARMIDNDFVGDLLRPALPEDEQILQGIRTREQHLFEDARRLADELQLPLEVLDVEATLDGHQVTLYYLRAAECDERPLVRALSQKYETLVALRNLALPEGASACGKADCGSGKDGCTSCGTGGGCSTCGSKTLSKEVQEYFGGLRRKMETNQRVPLV